MVHELEKLKGYVSNDGQTIIHYTCHAPSQDTLDELCIKQVGHTVHKVIDNYISSLLRHDVPRIDVHIKTPQTYEVLEIPTWLYEEFDYVIADDNHGDNENKIEYKNPDYLSSISQHLLRNIKRISK